jgi:hypothetical protein
MREILDPQGLATSDESISALIILKGKAADVNDKWKGKGWSPVEVYEVDEGDTAS